MGVMYSIYLPNARLGGGAQVMLAEVCVCVCARACMHVYMHSKQHLPNSCTWAAWLKQGPGPHGGVTKSAFLPQTCAHRYEARQRVDQILETRDVIGRCFVLSQDLAIRDELDGGEWKFCEGRPQGHEQFGFCQQGTAAAFSPDSHYLLFGAPGTYNWKGESLPGEGRREPKCPSTSERGLGAACGQACLRVHRHGAPGPRHASHHISPARTRLGPSISCPPHGREFCNMLA